ncbi:helix-turn-helix domain-containing protein [Novosphingobium sp.]|uniref:IclR family transcriptional regulator n=1 Tax=Novosphingobium sp. TaxID=1874826 RepID=UPI0026161493|nr:helix-turn-helix domain-containing protein [Novosphingobium sp.]
MAEPTEPPIEARSGGVDAVDRALAILQTFVVGHERQSLAQLAAATGLYKSTILRLARSLENGGFLHRAADGQFSLGPQPLRLAAIYRRGLRLEDHVRPVLRALVDETGESASFFRREGSSRLCLFREETRRTIRDHITEGDLLPMGQGAAGHILAGATGATRASDLALALSRGERDAETAALAAAVFGEDGLAGALTLSGPIGRFDDARVADMMQRLIEHARILTSQLGGQW